MLSIDNFPSNKEQFIRSIDFCKEIIDICDELDLSPVVYGSLAVFAYTKDRNMKVNDIDMLIPEKDFAKIIKVLKERKIRYDYDERWHVLQILKENLKIEFDSIDFWQKDLPQNFQELILDGRHVKILSLNTLKNIYKKASEVSQDNPKGNRDKFEALNKINSKLVS